MGRAEVFEILDIELLSELTVTSGGFCTPLEPPIGVRLGVDRLDDAASDIVGISIVGLSRPSAFAPSLGPS